MFRGLDAGNAPGADGRGVSRAGREDQPVAGMKLHVPSGIRKRKDDASFHAEKGLAIGMNMRLVSIARSVGPPAVRPIPGVEEAPDFLFRERPGMGPAQNLDVAGKGFMIGRRVQNRVLRNAGHRIYSIPGSSMDVQESVRVL